LRARLHPTVVLRAEDFGGIAYAPSRDDFFALDDTTYAFLRAFGRDRWLDIPDESITAVTRLAALELLDTTPPTSPESYSGPSFIGLFKDIVTLGEPLVLNCFSTAHCPLRCIYCHADDLMTAGQRDVEVAAYDLRLENVATTARSVDSVVAVITGGDPLTRPDRARFLISKLSGHKSLVLDTSGVAERSVVDPLIPFLRDHRVHVRVSLDSPDARVQRKIRPTNRAY
jgi:sulfatase maturation enzyme AslB (radical SAM superfamily)